MRLLSPADRAITALATPACLPACPSVCLLVDTSVSLAPAKRKMVTQLPEPHHIAGLVLAIRCFYPHRTASAPTILGNGSLCRGASRHNSLGDKVLLKHTSLHLYHGTEFEAVFIF